MSSNRSLVNLVFGCIVAVLGLTAVIAINKNLNSSTGKPAAASETAGSQMPADHPSLETAESLMALQRMIAEDPQNPDHLTQIANLYYDLGQFDKAADFYQQSLNIRAGDPGVETDLATCFRKLGQIDEALKTLDKVLQYQPGFPLAMLNKGIILAYSKNDVQGAIRVWEDLLLLDPAFSQEAELEQRLNQLRASVQ